MMHFPDKTNNRQFSHTYDTEEYGQIVVMMKPYGEGMGIDVYFNPPEFGLCTISMTFGEKPENPDTKIVARKFLNQCNAFEATRMVAKALMSAREQRPPHH